MRVLAISGSLRQHSYNAGLLRAAAEAAPEGVELLAWDGLKAIPPYDQDDDVVPGPPPVEAFRQAVRESDAVLIATPEYNRSLPGALKNALDWASRPFPTNALRNKPVAVIGTSPGALGAMRAQVELRRVLAAIGARNTEAELAIAKADEKFDRHGNLADQPTRGQLAHVVETLANAARAREPTLATA
jgi:chromate reductase, NAD(P)H dehydrogenase (quinone)